ncbi:polyprenyl synthetase family protein [Ostreibacterium oceani]|uniref:Farnesyl diphosphate synthase n=1 Tax=Ostreibacterium oceani TaxID=2654998 RepID=A0A6N7EVD8_9GAMM|nr:polyprenyl synthetase family protein [Ostreibacterium oceani]MPV86734.1 hypothetical protein [Ostreibacterium oceani]
MQQTTPPPNVSYGNPQPTTLQTGLLRYQTRFNDYASAHFPTSAPVIGQVFSAARYSFFNAGKRLRPALVYACADSFGIDLKAVDAIAFAIECIHTYSLIHDDLPSMDDDDMRRGKPACHTAFDEATAILAGDALNTFAFQHLAQSQSPYALNHIAVLGEHAGFHGMVGGQDMDIFLSRQAQTPHTPLAVDSVDINLLSELHRRKTGKLIQACLLLPYAHQPHPDPNKTHALNELGSALGLCYQIQDDILDVTQSAEMLGKPTHSDDDNNKVTYVSLLGLAGAQHAFDEQTKLVQTILRDLFGEIATNTPLGRIIGDILSRNR